jgi:hypothetical protein
MSSSYVPITVWHPRNKALCQEMSLSLAIWPVSMMDQLIYGRLREQRSALAGSTRILRKRTTQLQGMDIACGLVIRSYQNLPTEEQSSVSSNKFVSGHIARVCDGPSAL